MSTAAIVNPEKSKDIFTRAIRPLLSEADAYSSAGIVVIAFEYPYLDVELGWHLHGTSIRLRIDGTDYSYRPVRGWWIDHAGNPLLSGRGSVPNGPGFHHHRVTDEPGCWFCFLGWREYHDHPGHQQVSWAALRSQKRYGVCGLIAQLHQDINRPGVTKS
ncbi:hypothetical protein [Pandoraea sp. E26]|uniref:hypothetical protein n=1 Tax=Pandoraea sp. E26 TaxID=1427365 RepID=UPI0012689BE3|nr:hypothetical protein [Pandoraea sp. E26]